MAKDDTFIREVDEQIRQDSAREFWAKYGRIIIAAAVLVVAATAAFRGWQYYSEQKIAAAGDRFMTAIEAAEAGKHDEAQSLLDAIAASKDGNYPELARLRLAADFYIKGDKAAALDAYDAVAANASAPVVLREIARLRAGLLAVDLEDFASVEARLSTLASPGHALRHSAREALAIAAIKAGDDARALEWLTRIDEDNEAPDTVRNRVELMLNMLAGKGASAQG